MRPTPGARSRPRITARIKLMEKRDLEKLEFHLLDTGHFALEEDGGVIAGLMRSFLGRHVGSGE